MFFCFTLAMIVMKQKLLKGKINQKACNKGYCEKRLNEWTCPDKFYKRIGLFHFYHSFLYLYPYFISLNISKCPFYLFVNVVLNSPPYLHWRFWYLMCVYIVYGCDSHNTDPIKRMRGVDSTICSYMNDHMFGVSWHTKPDTLLESHLAHWTLNMYKHNLIPLGCQDNSPLEWNFIMN